jgi:hypothetical protein
MPQPRHRARRTVTALAGAGALALLLLSGAASAVAADGPIEDGIGLTVTVGPGGAAGAGPTATPVPTAPTSRATTTTTTVNGSTVVNDSQNPPAPTADERSIGGLLYVSGLSTAYTPSIDPFAGELEAHFTVRNVSTAAIDGTVKFWITSAFNTEISASGPVEVTGLQPGESRVVDAVLPGVGQYTFATAHYTYTPPATVEGTALSPLTRDAFVFLPPWFLLVLLAAACGAYAIVRTIAPFASARAASASTAVLAGAETAA